jgi:hypothetical protein
MVNLRYCRSRRKHGWGLAWFLAAQICDRFYSSHGIAPRVTEHGGLGYYGITLEYVDCRVNDKEMLGRFTMAGNVENWRTGGPGDHGLELADKSSAGMRASRMIAQAIRHLEFPVLPEHSHLQCRHKRWGASFQLVFRLAALIALRWENKVRITSPSAKDPRISVLDRKADMPEHPGYMVLESHPNKIILCCDGRVLQPVDQPSLWDRYMGGECIEDLMAWMEDMLQSDSPS